MYAVLEGFFSAAPFSKVPCPPNPSGLAGLKFDLFPVPQDTPVLCLGSLHPWGREEHEADLKCFLLLPWQLSKVSSIIVLYHSSNFYSRQVSQIPGTQSLPELEIREIHFCKGNEFKEHLYFSSAHRERLSIKILFINCCHSNSNSKLKVLQV